MEEWVTNEKEPPKEEKISLSELLPLIEEVINAGKAFRLSQWEKACSLFFRRVQTR